MASTTDIISQLYHGFHNNPDNDATFNAAANMLPPLAAIRGMRTLGRVPDQLGTPGQAFHGATGAISGLADVLPMAMAGTRPASFIGHELARQIEEGTGLFGSALINPRFNAVPPGAERVISSLAPVRPTRVFTPQQTLDEATALASKSPLRAIALRKKLSGNPSLLVPDQTLITPDNVSSATARLPQRYLQGAITGGKGGYTDTEVHNLAHDRLMDDHSYLIEEAADELADRYGISNDDVWENHREELLDTAHRSEGYADLLNEIRNEGEGGGGRSIGTNSFSPYQRLRQVVPQDALNNYFESVLRTRGQPGDGLDYAHFSNQGQIAHARGSVDPTGRSVYLEELQSDPNKLPDFDMRAPHAQMARALLQKASDAGVSTVNFPNGDLISQVRDPSKINAYQQIYDGELGKYLFRPLADRGVSVTPNSNGVTSVDVSNPDLMNNVLQDSSYAAGGAVSSPLRWIQSLRKLGQPLDTLPRGAPVTAENYLDDPGVSTAMGFAGVMNPVETHLLQHARDLVNRPTLDAFMDTVSRSGRRLSSHIDDAASALEGELPDHVIDSLYAAFRAPDLDKAAHAFRQGFTGVGTRATGYGPVDTLAAQRGYAGLHFAPPEAEDQVSNRLAALARQYAVFTPEFSPQARVMAMKFDPRLWITDNMTEHPNLLARAGGVEDNLKQGKQSLEDLLTHGGFPSAAYHNEVEGLGGVGNNLSGVLFNPQDAVGLASGGSVGTFPDQALENEQAVPYASAR